jgi:hypothetical protein
MNWLRILLARGVLFIATIRAIRLARQGNITEGKKILANSMACAHLPRPLRIKLAGAIGWQEGVGRLPNIQSDDAARHLASLSGEERRPIDPLTRGGGLPSSPESFSDEERAAAEKIFEVPAEGLGRFSR